MERLNIALCCDYIGKSEAFWRSCQKALDSAAGLPGVPEGLGALRAALLQAHDAPLAGQLLKQLTLAAAAKGQTTADLFPLGALAACLPGALEYQRGMGAGEAQLRATFGDMLRWEAWFERETGRPGLAELHWAVLPYAGDLFEIGSLQYQPIESRFSVYGWAAPGGGLLLLAGDGLPVDAQGRVCPPEHAVFTTAYRQEGELAAGHLIDPLSGSISAQLTELPVAGLSPVLAPGLRVLNLHIPAGADLSPTAVDDSLRAAKRFFAAAGRPAALAVCYSWMLDPQLAQFLPPASRILHLAGRFARFSLPGEGSAARFVFRTDTPVDRLPASAARTSLQRAVLAHLTSGGKLFDVGGAMLL